MNEFWIKVILNIMVGLVVFIGFWIFLIRRSGWFNEGGFIYEYFKTNKKTNNKNKPEKR